MNVLVMVLLSCFVFIAGCAAGVRHLGSVMLMDGSTREYVQIGSEGQDGPVLVAIEGYHYDPSENTSTLTSQYQASGPSLISDVLRGAASSALIAGGMVGAAVAHRPDQTKVTQGSTTATTGNVTQGSTTATTGNVTQGSPTATTGNVTQGSPTATSSSESCSAGGNKGNNNC